LLQTALAKSALQTGAAAFGNLHYAAAFRTDCGPFMIAVFFDALP